MSVEHAAALEDAATTDAQLTKHFDTDAYGRTYAYFRCQSCGTEATRRCDLAQGGCRCE